MRISICILTYNRAALLERLLDSLHRIEYGDLEIIVIDNDSADSTEAVVRESFPKVIYERMERNVGIAGRNAGISKATGGIAITLDDDVIGIDDRAINELINIFEEDSMTGAVCFKITAPGSSDVINWCHHYRAEDYSSREFVTNEITEGAVAFRRSVLEESGLYPGNFFISYEGPELACRIMNAGYNVIFSPKITVEHFHSRAGRKSWSRYYYDTRNQLWFVARNYPLSWSVNYLFFGIGAMLVYSIRDGYLKYWLKGVYDGLSGLPENLKHRQCINRRTKKIIKEINRNKPGLVLLAKKRLLSNEIRL